MINGVPAAATESMRELLPPTLFWGAISQDTVVGSDDHFDAEGAGCKTVTGSGAWLVQSLCPSMRHRCPHYRNSIKPTGLLWK